jgi:hypothetical protein
MKKKATIFAIILLTVSGCQRQEPKPGILSAPEELETTQKSTTSQTQPSFAGPKTMTLPPRTPSTPTSPRALTQFLPQPTPAAPKTFKTFAVYTDKNSSDNHFIPSGWMGDYQDITLTPDSFETPYSGSTCIKIAITNKASGGARWTGTYWQNPEHNWGNSATGGFDLTGAKKLTFWARGEKGGECIQEFKMGGISGAFPDSDTAGFGPVFLTQEWKQYTIGLAAKDLSHIIGGFAWSTNLDVNTEGCVFYLDDIKYE